MYSNTVAGGVCSVNPGMLPRIVHYDSTKLISLIGQDTLKLTNEKVYGMFMVSTLVVQRFLSIQFICSKLLNVDLFCCLFRKISQFHQF